MEVNFSSATFKFFYMCAGLLSLKMMAMSILTGRMRVKKKVVITPEDKSLIKNSQVNYNNPDVERIRRAHRNDIENIPVFITTGFFYSLTGPNPFIAMFLFLAYTVARFLHTYVYVINIKPQPARFICFAVAYVINLYLAASVMYTTGFV